MRVVTVPCCIGLHQCVVTRIFMYGKVLVAAAFIRRMQQSWAFTCAAAEMCLLGSYRGLAEHVRSTFRYGVRVRDVFSLSLSHLIESRPPRLHRPQVTATSR